MEIKKCPKCGRELSLTEFNKNRHNADGLQVYCRSCQYDFVRKGKERATAASNSCLKNSGGVNYTDPELDSKTNREVMDIMVRCKRWLEARGCTIHLSGEYTEVKKLKF